MSRGQLVNIDDQALDVSCNPNSVQSGARVLTLYVVLGVS